MIPSVNPCPWLPRRRGWKWGGGGDVGKDPRPPLLLLFAGGAFASSPFLLPPASTEVGRKEAEGRSPLTFSFYYTASSFVLLLRWTLRRRIALINLGYLGLLMTCHWLGGRRERREEGAC